MKTTEERLDAIEKKLGMTEEIMVPDGIEFSFSVGESCGMGIKFGNFQEIYWNYEDRSWGVETCLPSYLKTKLVKCSKEDVEIGKWYYCTVRDVPDFSVHQHYYLSVAPTRFIYINPEGVPDVYDDYFKHYYRVEEV